jgi:hypothetical protein
VDASLEQKLLSAAAGSAKFINPISSIAASLGVLIILEITDAKNWLLRCSI